MKKRFFDMGRERGLHGTFNNRMGSILADFTPDSIINLMLRKSDKLNFALNNQGNLYNYLINKVSRGEKIFLMTVT